MIKLVTVDLGNTKIRIPVAGQHGQSSGKTLLVTAGMDGDEYASIDAAYELIEELENKEIKGKITIIPIVNIPGFEAKTSQNPLDGKYLKLIYPGKESGSPSERLIHWLNVNYISKCNVWIDLHGGALGERLSPFVYMPQTKLNQLDKQYQSIIRMLPGDKIIFDRYSSWSFHQLHKNNIMHIWSEAGYSGDRSRTFINSHKKIVISIMKYFGVITELNKKKYPIKKVFSTIDTYKASYNGLWYPQKELLSSIKKGQRIGIVKKLDGSVLQEVFAKTDGEYLWIKVSMPCTKGETLIEIAIN